jgi:hypothetical protein
MPAQQRLRLNHERLPASSRQDPAQRRERQPVMRLESRLTGLPAEDRQLVPEHENLELRRPNAGGSAAGQTVDIAKSGLRSQVADRMNIEALGTGAAVGLRAVDSGPSRAGRSCHSVFGRVAPDHEAFAGTEPARLVEH